MTVLPRPIGTKYEATIADDSRNNGENESSLEPSVS